MWITTSSGSLYRFSAKRGRDSGQMTEEILQGVLQTICRTGGVLSTVPPACPSYTRQCARFVKLHVTLTLASNICGVSLQHRQQPSSRGASLILKEQRSQMNLRMSNGLAPILGGLFHWKDVQEERLCESETVMSETSDERVQKHWRVLPENEATPQTSNSRSSNRRHLYIQIETHQHKAKSAMMQ